MERGQQKRRSLGVETDLDVGTDVSSLTHVTESVEEVLGCEATGEVRCPAGQCLHNVGLRLAPRCHYVGIRKVGDE